MAAYVMLGKYSQAALKGITPQRTKTGHQPDKEMQGPGAGDLRAFGRV